MNSSDRDAYEPYSRLSSRAIRTLAAPLNPPFLLLLLNLPKLLELVWLHSLRVLVVQAGKAVCADVDEVAVRARDSEAGEGGLLEDGVYHEVLVSDEGRHVAVWLRLLRPISRAWAA